MFWGIVIEPNGSFEMKSEDILHITHICLNEELKDEKYHRIYLKFNSEEICITNFTNKNINNKISVIIEPDQPFVLLNKTQNKVFISGYTIVQIKPSPEMEDSLIVEKQQMQKSRKSEKRKSVVAPRKSSLSPASKKTVKIGGVEKAISIESVEERVKKQARRQRTREAFGYA